MRWYNGSQFRNMAAIVASPPCTEYSYMAQPWKRGKQIAAALRGKGEFPKGYKGSRTIERLNALFHACFRIQREAREAAGHEIPMVVENVQGAQPWVGRAKWHYGSFYLWGDVPALMPFARAVAKVPGLNWNGSDQPGYKAHNTESGHGQNPDGRKRLGEAAGTWFDKGDGNFIRSDTAATSGKKRAQASAKIAIIPPPLAQHIARVFKP